LKAKDKNQLNSLLPTVNNNNKTILDHKNHRKKQTNIKQ